MRSHIVVYMCTGEEHEGGRLGDDGGSRFGSVSFPAAPLQFPRLPARFPSRHGHCGSSSANITCIQRTVGQLLERDRQTRQRPVGVPWAEDSVWLGGAIGSAIGAESI